MSEVPVIQRAREMCHRVIVVDRDIRSPGFDVNGLVSECNNIADKDKVLELAQKYKIDGIISSVDAGVRPAAYVCQRLGLPGIREEAALWGTDNTLMKKVARIWSAGS